MSIRLGIDVGGTFTDLALWDEAAGALAVFKLPSVRSDPAEGIIAGLRAITDSHGIAPSALSFVAHGTTVGTNALLEKRGARAALVTTQGFRDLLEIARQKRPDLYDLQADKPIPLVSRDRRHEVRERLLWDGTILWPLNEGELEHTIDLLEKDAVEAVAICLLYSFVDGSHERAVANRIRTRLPQCYVSLSSEVSPQFREYERLSTTVLNAYLGPVISRYVQRFQDEVQTLGIARPPYINQSNGGIISVQAAAEHPVRTLLSGPSAGVMGAAWVAGCGGVDSLITFDMGGTSTDVALVERGQPVIASERTLDGYPVRIPTLEIETVGAGGGSIAWIDSGGVLKVGPQSAGAHPGPASYGRGGILPTVTDANVVLGRLNPTHLLDGRMTIERDHAVRAITTLSDDLGLSMVEAACGILSVVNANMLGAIRVVSIRKGYDPRNYVLVAFGGAGPLHAAALARDLGIPEVLVPPSPGILCAIGLLVEPLRLDLVRTRLSRLESNAIAEVASVFEELEAEATMWLDSEMVPTEKRRMIRGFDLRYLGQNFELAVPAPEEFWRGDESALRQNFFREHERAYGYFADDEPVQIVACRLTALGETDALLAPSLSDAGEIDPARALVGERHVYFEATGGFAPTPIYRRERLLAQHRIPGPAIVEQMDSTTVIPPGQTAVVDLRGNIRIRSEEA